MTVVDILVLGTLAIGLVLGLARGFISQFTGIAGLVGGVYLAGNYYTPLRNAALDPNFDTGHNGGIAFVFIVVFTVLVAAVVGYVVRKGFEKLDLGAYDRLAGAGFGAAKAGLIAAAIMLAVVYFAPDGGKIEQSIGSSKSAPMLWNTMDSVAGVLPKPYRAGVQEFLSTHGLPAVSQSGQTEQAAAE